jgi:ABC-type bacteriocin/lantibiotic exporter with double-glycine peptidase domain
MDRPKFSSSGFWEDIRLAWNFRPFFLPFLLPATSLLLLSLLQASLLFSSTVAGQRIIDLISSRLAGRSPGLPSHTSGFWPVSGETPVSLALLMGALLLTASVVGILAEQLRLGLSQRFRFRIQSELLQALMFETGEMRAQRQTGEMIKTFSSDAAGLSAFLIFGILGVFENGVKAVTYTAGLCRIPEGWKVAIMIVPVAILIQGAVNRAFSGIERRRNERSDALNRQVAARTVRFFELVGRLVYFGGELNESRKVLSLMAEAGKANRRFSLTSSTRAAAAGIVTSLTLPLIVIVLANGFGSVTPGTIVQAQGLLGLLLGTISALSSTPLQVTAAGPGMRQVRKVLDIPKPGPAPAQLLELASRKTAASLKLLNLTFRYGGATKPVLCGVTVDIPPGAVVGITGRSGCGKSTLGKLLNGDLMPVGGSIYVDEVDVTNWHLVWKRKLFGYLPTGFEFLDGTIEENVLMGRNHSEVDQFEDAVRLSGVARFLRTDGLTLQHSIRSLSGEGYLSFGQRRRIGIAQLLCGRQRILVFDEPGSSLDPDTMVAVAGSLREAVRGRTTLIITHDPDIFQTDFNIFIKDGAIADIGRHLELMRRNADYFDLLNKNIGERNEPAVHEARSTT